MFSELNIRNIIQGDEDYVNVQNLVTHLMGSIQAISEDINTVKDMTEQERTYLLGVGSGIREVAILLMQGETESRLNRNVNTVDDLINF